MTGDISVIVEEVRPAGFSFVPAEQFRALLAPSALAEWPSFAASWDDLGVDTYMADGGRYRRRRFATFAVSADGVVRKTTSRTIRAGTTTRSMGESNVGSDR
jgi:hypothetical protein